MKKHLFLKSLLIALGLLIMSINTAWGQSFGAENQRQAQMQSQMMMSSGSSYTGTVYEPFSNTTPSEQSYTPAKAPGASRRGYNPETGEYTPDAPDIETAGDTGNSNESPIGEPWVMLLMALAFGGWIAAKQVRKKIIKQENNTLNKFTMKGPKFIAILVMLLTLGVESMCADNGFFSTGQWKVGYNTGGDDIWIDYQNNATSYDLGTQTTLVLKGSNVKTWGDGQWQVVWNYGWTEWSTTNYWVNKSDHSGDTEWYFGPTSYDMIANATNAAGPNTLYMHWRLNDAKSSGSSTLTFTIPGFTTTSTSQTFDNTTVSSNSSKTISFGTHYGTALTTGNCSLSGTNASEFSVTSITENNVTVRFAPTSAGNKSATLTITDAHGKTCTITLSGKTQYTVTYNKGTYGTGDNRTANKVYGTNLTLADKGYFTRTGYTQTAWNTNMAGTGGTSYELNGTYSTEAAITLYPTWAPTQYTITFDKQSGSDGTNSATVHYTQNDFSVSPVVAPTRTGYTFGGYYSGTNGSGEMIVNADGTWVDPASAGTYLDESGYWNYAGNLTVYAQWTPITYTVVFNGNGSTGGSMANQGFTYDVAQSLTANAFTKDGYYFVGWATTAEGDKAYNDGQSVSNLRNTSGNFNLFAKWEQSELTNLTFTPSSPAPEGDVAITPVFDHEPTGTTVICYELHSNSTATAEVPGTTFAVGGDSKVHFNAPSASGTYYVKATFREGSSCSGTALNTIVVPIVISSDHTVTVRYMCDDVAIHAPSEYVVPAGGTLAITALEDDDVFGYSFDSWALGDGINQESVAGGTITISAFFNGVLTANYTKKNIIYFKDNLEWTDPEDADAHVYVNFLNGSWWDATRGTGNNTLADDRRNKEMSRVPGSRDVFYYEYGTTTIPTKYVSFTKESYPSYESFSGTEGNPALVCYPTIPNPNNSQGEMDYFGFYSNTPMFVPAADYPGDLWNKSTARYYNSGYWTKYTPGTGYYVRIYDPNNQATLLKRVEMVSENDLIPMTATTDLEANKTYFFEIEREGQEYYSNGDNTMTYANRYGRGTPWEFYRPSTYKKTKITTTAAGSYIFHMTHAGNQVEHNNSDVWRLRVAVEYPISNGDYRLIYKDDTHPNGKASAIVTNAAGSTDIVSFFVRNDQNPRLYIQKSTVADNGSITWAEYPTPGTPTNQITGDIASAITEYGVYNFNLVMDESGDMTVASAEPYEGNFYIRVDVANNKWDNYRDAAHVMAYSDFSISNSNSGEKYSHYWMKYCTGGENVKFVVANDYSPAISDTIVQQSPEVAHIDANGDNSALVSIRFSYNMKTNVAKRTYLAASSESSDFLVLQNSAAASSGNFTDANGTDKGGVDIKFSDKENFIYDITAKVKPNANVRVKVFAHYNETFQNFIGNHDVATFNDDSDSKLLLSGTGQDLQTIRILYDFKTNRLVSAWQASGTTTGELKIDADLMIVREHQEAADNIILAYDDLTKKDGKITTDKRIYAVMRFNRWILNNLDHPEDKEADHAHTDNYTTYHQALEPRYQLPTYERNLYYISFPFDVNVSDIFGFGTYGTHYAIQRYDGIGRAKNGYWVDSDPNWKWVPPTGKLNAFEGYVLSLSLSNMYVTNTNVWANNCSEVELYFPSAEEGFTIDTKDVTIAAINGEGSEYKCTINRGTSEGDRRFKDSYWRCIGVPSFANYETALISDGSTTINWQPASVDENDEGTIPFIYNINWNDKSLTAYEGSTFPFKAMHSYLVQYGGGIHWSNVVVSSPASVVARQRNENTTEHTFCLKLMQGDTFGDQTFVRMTDKEGVTTGFDFDQDLWKQKFANRANIYTFIGYEQVAGNSMPMSEQTTVVPVGVQIASDGEYTFVMPEGTEGVGVVLIDNIAGTRTNLALTDYTVYLTAGTHDERFILEISPMAQTPTDIESVAGEGSEISGARKMVVDGILYIVKDGKVFDARGNRIQ